MSRVYLDKRGYPFTLRKNGILPESRLGLNVGDRVLQIGRPAKSGKITSASRVQKFDRAVIYQGVLKDGGDRFLAFKYRQDGITYYILYKYSTRNREIYLVNEKTLSILIYKAVFRKEQLCLW